MVKKKLGPLNIVIYCSHNLLHHFNNKINNFIKSKTTKIQGVEL